VAGFAAFAAYRIGCSNQDNRRCLFDAIENHNERKPFGMLTAPKSVSKNRNPSDVNPICSARPRFGKIMKPTREQPTTLPVKNRKTENRKPNG
jgi:hypothetical protein